MPIRRALDALGPAPRTDGQRGAARMAAGGRRAWHDSRGTDHVVWCRRRHGRDPVWLDQPTRWWCRCCHHAGPDATVPFLNNLLPIRGWHGELPVGWWQPPAAVESRLAAAWKRSAWPYPTVASCATARPTWCWWAGQEPVRLPVAQGARHQLDGPLLRWLGLTEPAMRELILLRHAHAGRPARPVRPGPPLSRRPRRGRGRGGGLPTSARARLRLCSPARRTRETTETVLSVLGHVDQRLKSASTRPPPAPRLGLIEATAMDRLLLVGHNPGLSGWWRCSAAASPPVPGMPPAGIAVLEFADGPVEPVPPPVRLLVAVTARAGCWACLLPPAGPGRGGGGQVQRSARPRRSASPAHPLGQHRRAASAWRGRWRCRRQWQVRMGWMSPVEIVGHPRYTR